MSKKILKWIYEKKNWVYAVFSCFAMMVVLNADLGSISTEVATEDIFNFVAINIKKLEYLLPCFSYRDAILSFLIFFFFLKTEDAWSEEISRLAYRIPAALTAFFLVFGYSFRYTNSWNLIFMDTFHKMIAGLMAVGFYFLFVRIYQLMVILLRGNVAGKEQNAGKFTRWLFDKHAFGGPFLV